MEQPPGSTAAGGPHWLNERCVINAHLRRPQQGQWWMVRSQLHFEVLIWHLSPWFSPTLTLATLVLCSQVSRRYNGSNIPVNIVSLLSEHWTTALSLGPGPDLWAQEALTRWSALRRREKVIDRYLIRQCSESFFFLWSRSLYNVNSDIPASVENRSWALKTNVYAEKPKHPHTLSTSCYLLAKQASLTQTLLNQGGFNHYAWCYVLNCKVVKYDLALDRIQDKTLSWTTILSRNHNHTREHLHVFILDNFGLFTTEQKWRK